VKRSCGRLGAAGIAPFMPVASVDGASCFAVCPVKFMRFYCGLGLREKIRCWPGDAMDEALLRSLGRAVGVVWPMVFGDFAFTEQQTSRGPLGRDYKVLPGFTRPAGTSQAKASRPRLPKA